MQGDREKCLEAGMNDYVSKPIRLEELEAVILRQLRTVVDGQGDSMEERAKIANE
jgi:CheY-like chemotaxis protein